MAIVNKKNMAIGLFALLASGSAAAMIWSDVEEPTHEELAESFVLNAYPDNIDPFCDEYILKPGQTVDDIPTDGVCQHIFSPEYDFFSWEDLEQFRALLVDEMIENPAMVPVLIELMNMRQDNELSIALYHKDICTQLTYQNEEPVVKELTNGVQYSTGHFGAPDPHITVCGNPEQATIIQDTAQNLVQSFIDVASYIGRCGPDEGYGRVYEERYTRLSTVLGGDLPKYPDFDDFGFSETLRFVPAVEY